MDNMEAQELEKYLEKHNKEFQKLHIEPKRRPFEFIARYSIEINQPINLSSYLEKYIFEWFEKRSMKGAHSIGNLYTSVYYYDAQFWELTIPMFYGTVELNALDSLKSMPDIVKRDFLNNDKQRIDFIACWTDCLDYAIGLSELKKKTDIEQFGKKLLLAAHDEMKSATSNLLSLPMQKRAIINCTMAVEIGLKAYIALKKGLTEKEAKRFGHDLNKLLDETIKLSGNCELEILRERFKFLPDISSRYQEQELSLLRLWNGYVLAQTIMSFVVRDFTGHNYYVKMITS